MGARSRCAVACAAALAAMPSPAYAAPTYGSRLGSHSMLHLNHTAVQHEALFRAASEARLRYLRDRWAHRLRSGATSIARSSVHAVQGASTAVGEAATAGARLAISSREAS